MIRISVLLASLPFGCYAQCFSGHTASSYFAEERLVEPVDFRNDKLLRLSGDILAAHRGEFIDVKFFRSDLERRAFGYVSAVGFESYKSWRQAYDEFLAEHGNLQDHSWAIAELISVNSCSILLIRDGPRVSRYALSPNSPLTLKTAHGQSFEVVRFSITGGGLPPNNGPRLSVFLKSDDTLSIAAGREAWHLLAQVMPFREITVKARVDGWFAEDPAVFFDPFREDLSPPSESKWKSGELMRCFTEESSGAPGSNVAQRAPYCAVFNQGR